MGEEVPLGEVARAGDGSIRVTTYNVFLIPGLLTKKHSSMCTRQNERAAALGEFAATCDVVCMQEVWGSQLTRLTAPMLRSGTHTIPKKTQSWGFGGASEGLFGTVGSYVGSVLDTVWLRAVGTGGLFFAARNTLPMTHSAHRVFSFSNSKSGKGVQGFLLDMAQRWGEDTQLLVINTHLDPFNDNDAQTRQLAKMIELEKNELNEQQQPMQQPMQQQPMQAPRRMGLRSRTPLASTTAATSVPATPTIQQQQQQQQVPLPPPHQRRPRTPPPPYTPVKRERRARTAKTSC